MKLLLKNKIIISIVSLILLFGSIATYAVFLMTKNNLVDLEKRNLASHVELHNNEISNVLLFSSELVSSLASNPQVIEVLTTDSSDKEATESLTNHFLKTYNIGDMYSAIYLMNTEGLTIVSTDISFVGKNYGFREYFISSIVGQPYTDFSIGATSKKPGYYFSHPVKNSDNEIVGVAVVKMKPDFLVNSFDHDRFDNMEMMFIDSYGVIVFSTDDSKTFHSLGEILDKTFNDLKDRRYGGFEINVAGYSEVQKNLSNIEVKPSIFEIFDEKDNSDEYVVISKIEEFPFYVMADIDIKEIVNLSIRSSTIIASLVLLSAVIVGIMNSLLVNKFLSPLDKLREVTEKVAEGDLSEKIEIKEKDELGLLAGSFNKMIDSVIKAKADIDTKVEEQTKELALQKEEAEEAMKIAEEVSSAMAGREIKMMELKEEINKLKSKK